MPGFSVIRPRLMLNSITLGDCLEVMSGISDKSIDLILCDLPYGTTACKWDAVIPFEPLWAHYWRVIKDNGAIVLTASQPFTSALVMSQLKFFRYDLVWDKVNLYTGALNANRMPLRRHESILVFYRKLPTFNKQFRTGKAFKMLHTQGHGLHTQYGNPGEKRRGSNDGEHHNPCSILPFKADLKLEKGLHPTQKPHELFEWLIKTYSNEGETVLDNACGSGTTGVAAINTNRNFILIEKDPGYFEIARNRLGQAIALTSA